MKIKEKILQKLKNRKNTYQALGVSIDGIRFFSTKKDLLNYEQTVKLAKNLKLDKITVNTMDGMRELTLEQGEKVLNAIRLRLYKGWIQYKKLIEGIEEKSLEDIKKIKWEDPED